ncbi:MAG: hypothetical protein GC155_14135 [Alphaproteobacteria bacterium]|nr:hypothetical protein [Alphaproteobacteria bacterium]
MLSACTYPTSTVTQGGTSSSLNFGSLPKDAVISVDGTTAGKAGDFAGKRVLAVTPGTHRVRVESAAGTLVDRDYYVGRDSSVKVEAAS